MFNTFTYNSTKYNSTLYTHVYPNYSDRIRKKVIKLLFKITGHKYVTREKSIILFGSVIRRNEIDYLLESFKKQESNLDYNIYAELYKTLKSDNFLKGSKEFINIYSMIFNASVLKEKHQAELLWKVHLTRKNILDNIIKASATSTVNSETIIEAQKKIEHEIRGFLNGNRNSLSTLIGLGLIDEDDDKFFENFEG